MQWFNEGFTEYYTNLALLKTGIISEKEYWRKQEMQFGLYTYFRLYQYPEISLKEASANKSRYRFGVYNGGSIGAFVLDMMIQEKTTGTKSLDDVMRYMMENYGKKEELFTLKDLINAVYNVSGLDANTFFDKYITGKELLPFEEYLNKIGIEVEYVPYEAEAFIRKNNNLKSPLGLIWKKRITAE